MTVNIYTLSDVPDEIILSINKQEGFFTSFRWYGLFIDTIISVESDQYKFLVIEDDHSLDNIVLPVKIDNSLSCRILMSLTNYYSPIYNIVKKTGSDSSTKQLWTYLKNMVIPWDVLKLQPMDKNHVVDTVIELKKAGIPAIPFFCFGNWYLEVNGRSYDDYFSGLSSRVKNTLIRKTKRFLAMQNAKLVIVSDENNLDAAILEYNRVYKASWKTEETYPDFISGLCRLAAKEGALRLGLAYIDNVAVAAQLWIVADNTAYIYKLAYDEAYKEYAVGSILTAKLMQYVLDVDKVDVVDYLSGDDAYKKDWMSHRRERWGILAFNCSSPRGMWAMIQELSKFYIKSFSRRL